MAQNKKEKDIHTKTQRVNARIYIQGSECFLYVNMYVCSMFS